MNSQRAKPSHRTRELKQILDGCRCGRCASCPTAWYQVHKVVVHLFYCWEQKTIVILVVVPVFCRRTKRESIRARPVHTRAKQHAIGVVSDARRASRSLSSPGFWQLPSSVTRSPIVVSPRLSPTKVVDDFFPSRCPDLSLPLCSLSSSASSASFRAH